MRYAALAVLLLAGCGDDHYPPIGGAGGGGGGGAPDAAPRPDAGAPDAQEGAVTVSGRVCRVDDMRFPDACPSGDLSGVSVRLQSNPGVSTSTQADGSFSLTFAPTQSRVVLVAAEGATDLRPSLVPIDIDIDVGATNVVVPAPALEYWNDLITTLAVADSPGGSNIALRLLDGTQSAPGVRLTAPQGTLNLPFFDDGGALQWLEDTQTGPDGTALLFGVPTDVPQVSVEALPPGAMFARMISGIPVGPGFITFDSADIGQ